jgi:hypothetical protein
MTAGEEPRARKRFRRAGADLEPAGLSESLAAVHAEVLLLREENARLKATQHGRADVSRLLERARSASTLGADRDGAGDDSAQLLIDGLVVRESLLEICREIERAMVAFEARLDALEATAVDVPEPVWFSDRRNGNGSRHP